MTKLIEAASEMEYIKGGLLLHGELLRDLSNELADLSESVTDTKIQNAMYDFARVQRKIRLLYKIAANASMDFDREYNELDKNVSTVIREVQKKEIVVVKTKKA